MLSIICVLLTKFYSSSEALKSFGVDQRAKSANVNRYKDFILNLDEVTDRDNFLIEQGIIINELVDSMLQGAVAIQKWNFPLFWNVITLEWAFKILKN